MPSVAPVQGVPTRRYFLDRNGVTTQRMAAVAGKGHYESAKAVTGAESGELYTRMSELGFARVMETTKEIHVEAKRLTRQQQRYLDSRADELGCEVVLNNQMFIESKDSRAGAIVCRLLQ